MTIKDWIDTLIDHFGTITYEGKQIRSYRIYKKSEIPEAIIPEQVPCAITYLTGVYPELTAGISIEYSYGTTEFYLTNNASKENYAKVLDFYPLIRNKFGENLTLGGLVSEIRLYAPEGSASIRFVEIQYSEEPARHGIIVDWRVKEIISDELTVAA